MTVLEIHKPVTWSFIIITKWCILYVIVCAIVLYDWQPALFNM